MRAWGSQFTLVWGNGMVWLTQIWVFRQVGWNHNRGEETDTGKSSIKNNKLSDLWIWNWKEEAVYTYIYKKKKVKFMEARPRGNIGFLGLYKVSASLDRRRLRPTQGFNSAHWSSGHGYLFGFCLFGFAWHIFFVAGKEQFLCSM